MNEEYHGWKNKETWYVSMELINDDKKYEEIVKVLSKKNTIIAFRTLVMGWYTEDLSKPGFVKDLLTHTFMDVDWKALKESYKDDLDT